MLCFLTVRKLKPGSYEAFREASDPGEDVPDSFIEGFTRACHLRDLEDENEVISFGFFEGDRDYLERMRSDDALRSLRAQQLERINEHMESPAPTAYSRSWTRSTSPAGRGVRLEQRELACPRSPAGPAGA